MKIKNSLNRRVFFKSNKTLVLILLLILLLFVDILWRHTSITKYMRLLPPNLQAVLRIIYEFDLSANKINNDYNVTFLPKTQFLDLGYKKKKLDFLEKTKKGYQAINYGAYKSFYLDLYDENLFILTPQGRIYNININQILKKKLILQK